MPRVDEAFKRQLEGYSLATAEITYHLPDAKSLLQTYLWQDYDLAPKFPILRKFLDFWTAELEGPLHSVRVTHSELITPREFRLVDKEFVVQ